MGTDKLSWKFDKMLGEEWSGKGLIYSGPAYSIQDEYQFNIKYSKLFHASKLPGKTSTT